MSPEIMYAFQCNQTNLHLVIVMSCVSSVAIGVLIVSKDQTKIYSESIGILNAIQAKLIAISSSGTRTRPIQLKIQPNQDGTRMLIQSLQTRMQSAQQQQHQSFLFDALKVGVLSKMMTVGNS
jgi:hypothetical protein